MPTKNKSVKSPKYPVAIVLKTAYSTEASAKQAIAAAVGKGWETKYAVSGTKEDGYLVKKLSARDAKAAVKAAAAPVPPSVPAAPAAAPAAAALKRVTLGDIALFVAHEFSTDVKDVAKRFGMEETAAKRILVRNGCFQDTVIKGKAVWQMHDDFQHVKTVEELAKALEVTVESLNAVVYGGEPEPEKGKHATPVRVGDHKRKSDIKHPVQFCWQTFDAMRDKPRKEVVRYLDSQGIAYSTARTQYYFWKRAGKPAEVPTGKGGSK